MARIERTARLNAPVGEVFAYVADFRTLREYNPSVREVRCLDDSPPGKGSRFDLTLAMPLGQLRTRLTITAFKHDELIATRLDAFIPAEETRIFRSEGGATLFVFTIEFATGWPLVGPLVDRLLARWFAGPQAATEIRMLGERFA